MDTKEKIVQSLKINPRHYMVILIGTIFIYALGIFTIGRLITIPGVYIDTQLTDL